MKKRVNTVRAHLDKSNYIHAKIMGYIGHVERQNGRLSSDKNMLPK